MYAYFLKFYSSNIVSGLFIAALFTFIACSPGDNRNSLLKNEGSDREVSMIRYAIGFDLFQKDGYQKLNLYRHYNNIADTTCFFLAPNNNPAPGLEKDCSVIRTPVERIALLHASYIGFFEFCNALNQIKAISEVKYVYHDSIYQSARRGDLPEVSFGETLDKEQILALDIDLVITVGWPNSPNKNQQMLEELGIPVLVFSEWQETTLLGRAEWVKIVGALSGKSDQVNAKFDEIVHAYDTLVELAAQASSSPTILCNLPYKGSWYVPGGNSYMSNLFRDAGGAYLWSDDPGTGGLQLDFESVYAKGITADVWINPGTVNSVQGIADSDPRLNDFKSVRSGRIFNSTNRIFRNQANDYWESAIIQPHLVLADLISALHPDLLPGHHLVYFKQLR